MRKGRQLLWILRTWCWNWVIRSKLGRETINLMCVGKVMQRDGRNRRGQWLGVMVLIRRLSIDLGGVRPRWILVSGGRRIFWRSVKVRLLLLVDMCVLVGHDDSRKLLFVKGYQTRTCDGIEHKQPNAKWSPESSAMATRQDSIIIP